MSKIFPLSVCVGIAATACLLLTGCLGSGDGLVPVTGKVTFDGAPIEDGRIQFRSIEGDQRAFAGVIENGEYTVRVEPGPTAVEIRASRLIEGKFDESNPGEPAPMGEMYIPEKYNSRTELEVTVEGSEVQKDFELTS